MAISKTKFKTNLVRFISNHFVSLLPETFTYTVNGELNDVTIETAEQFRKIISTGQITNTSGEQSQPLVLYQQDYQSHNTDFDDIIDIVSRCYCTGDVIPSDDGVGHICSTDNYGSENEDFSSIIYLASYGGSEFLDTLTFLVPDGMEGNPNCSGVQSLPIDETVLSILSQFIPLSSDTINIDPTQAQQVLDTNIFELMPQQKTRQDLIDKFFVDYQNLKGSYPETPWPDENNDGILDTPIPRDLDDISMGGNSITRLNLSTENDDLNQNKTLEWLRNDLNFFLEDVDQHGVDDLDDRPVYQDKSDGYLKIRHMNQSIIIRKEEGTGVGLMKGTSTTFNYDGAPTNCIGPSYLCDGFTITMWVKFLDQINSGTLFNFGNPLRADNPMGFMLETFVVKQTDSGTWSGTLPDDAFLTNDSERFIRLVVRDENDMIRDSHIATTDLPRLNTTLNEGGISTNGLPVLEHDNNGTKEAPNYQSGYAFNYTKVPIDLNEWYFIVANYNPFVWEDDSSAYDSYNSNSHYWRWNIDEASAFTSYSGLGARCKVEIISKSDLIRARGFKLPE